MNTAYDVFGFGTVVNNAFSLVGKKFHSEKTAYVLTQMFEAVNDQKEAIKEATGLIPDPYLAKMVSRGIEVNVIGGSNPEDGEDGIDVYNEGWLYGFFRGLEKAEKDMVNGVWFSGSKEDYLVKFLTDQRDLLKANWEENPTHFNKGAFEGYENWIDGLVGGWVNF